MNQFLAECADIRRRIDDVGDRVTSLGDASENIDGGLDDVRAELRELRGLRGIVLRHEEILQRSGGGGGMAKGLDPHHDLRAIVASLSVRVNAMAATRM